jgi:SAM-dependent methyltransferase
MTTVLLLNSTPEACGVHQFLHRIYNLVKDSKNINYIYKELDSVKDYYKIKREVNPDFILYNWHRATMGWLTSEIISNDKSIKHYFLFHEVHNFPTYDKYLFFGDTDLGNQLIPNYKSIVLPRPLLEYKGEYPKNEIPTIGSFGFGFWNKGFHTLAKLVNDTFDKAILNILIPYSYFADPSRKENQQVEKTCRRAITNPNIQLNISHEFLDDESLLKFLAGNDINAFMYTENEEGGISSTPDYCLSVKRPLAISNSKMFRHIYKDDISLEKNSLQQIIDKGTQPLEEFYKKWSVENFRSSMDKVFIEDSKNIVNIKKFEGETYNRLLVDRDRNSLNPLVTEMVEVIPEMMSRKYDRANVQQAITIDFIRKNATKQDKLLCIGSYEDTAYEFILRKGFDAIGIDPAINSDLHTFFTQTDRKFDLIFSVSVIEHVEKDEEFIDEICKLLKPGGKAVLTCDFSNSYKVGKPKPSIDVRLYTSNDILFRFQKVLDKNKCRFLVTPNFEGTPDFVYENSNYSFAVFSFEKMK